MATLSSSNGMGALVYDATQYKVTEFLEHPYQAASSTVTSRNFAYDSYPGIRLGVGGGTWLNTVTPDEVDYVPATGIVHATRSLKVRPRLDLEMSRGGLDPPADACLSNPEVTPVPAPTTWLPPFCAADVNAPDYC